VKSKLYQQEELKIQVTNIFSKSPVEQSEFTVKLIQERVQTKAKKGQKQGVKTDEEPQVMAFFLVKNKQKIRRGETVQFAIQFLPVSMEPYHCKIIFVDNAVGEFQHEINGEVSLPEVIAEIKPPLNFVDQKFTCDIPITQKNEFRVQALQKIDQKLGNKNAKGEQGSDNDFLNTSLSPSISFIQFQPVFELEQKGLKTNQSGSEGQKFSLNIHFLKPIVNFQTHLIMQSPDLKDVRVYKLNITILPKPIQVHL